MNPHQKNKVDVSSLTPEEQRLFRLYGKLPSKSDHFAKHLKERKYFDSGDYAMSKAGKGDSVDTGSVGSQHPVPENIPHLSSPNHGLNGGPGHQHHPSMSGGQSGQQGVAQAVGGGPVTASSPVKESYLHRETSADESAVVDEAPGVKENVPVEGASTQQAIPIRR